MSRITTVRFPGSSLGQALGLALEDKAPDAKACPELDPGTAWLYREQLSRAGVIEVLFEEFDACLKIQGDQATGVPIVDASIVALPIQRNSRDDKEQINNGEIPEAWADKPVRRRQIDTDARWTKSTASGVQADSACRLKDMEARVKAKGIDESDPSPSMS